MNVDYINDLYARLDRGDHLDPTGGSSIRFWMKFSGVTFQELNFTKADLEAKVRRVMVRYINDLYATLDRGDHFDPTGGSSIRFWMKSSGVTFQELNFTKADLEAKVRRVMVRYIFTRCLRREV